MDSSQLERWRKQRSRFRRASEMEQAAPGTNKGLKLSKDPGLDSDSAHGKQVEGIVKRRVGEERFMSRRDHCGGEAQLASRFPQKHGLPCLDFHHGQTDAGKGERERQGRRPSARTDVDQRPGTFAVRRGQQRLDQESIETFRRRIRKIQPGQVDLGVPLREQLEVNPELVNERAGDPEPRLLRAPQETLFELSSSHRGWTNSGKPGEIGVQHGDRRWGHAGNPRRLTQGLWVYLAQALDDLA